MCYICQFVFWYTLVMNNLSKVPKFKFDPEAFDKTAKEMGPMINRNNVDEKLQEIGITLEELKEALKYE